MSGEFLIISGEGQAYGEDDAETWLRETGWHKAERRPLGGPNRGRFRIRVKSGHKGAGCMARARFVISPTIPRLARPPIFA
jgi:hypothetical protein